MSSDSQIEFDCEGILPLFSRRSQLLFEQKQQKHNHANNHTNYQHHFHYPLPKNLSETKNGEFYGLFSRELHAPPMSELQKEILELNSSIFKILSALPQFSAYVHDETSTENFRQCCNAFQLRPLDRYESVFDIQDTHCENYYVIVSGKVGLFSSVAYFSGQEKAPSIPESAIEAAYLKSLQQQQQSSSKHNNHSHSNHSNNASNGNHLRRSLAAAKSGGKRFSKNTLIHNNNNNNITALVDLDSKQSSQQSNQSKQQQHSLNRGSFSTTHSKQLQLQQSPQLLHPPQQPQQQQQQPQSYQASLNVQQSYNFMKELSPGDSFGSLELLSSNVVGYSSFSLAENTVLLVLAKEDFLHILRPIEEARLSANLAPLKASSAINFLSFNAIKDLYIKSFTAAFRKHSPVCLQNIEPTAVYFVLTGEFSLWSSATLNANRSPPAEYPYQITSHKYNNTTSIKTSVIGEGEVFGDLEILNSTGYSHTLRCESLTGELLVIPRAVFEAKIASNAAFAQLIRARSNVITSNRSGLQSSTSKQIEAFRHFRYDADDTDSDDAESVAPKSTHLQYLKKTRKRQLREQLLKPHQNNMKKQPRNLTTSQSFNRTANPQLTSTTTTDKQNHFMTTTASVITSSPHESHKQNQSYTRTNTNSSSNNSRSVFKTMTNNSIRTSPTNRSIDISTFLSNNPNGLQFSPSNYHSRKAQVTQRIRTEESARRIAANSQKYNTTTIQPQIDVNCISLEDNFRSTSNSKKRHLLTTGQQLNWSNQHQNNNLKQSGKEQQLQLLSIDNCMQVLRTVTNVIGSKGGAVVPVVITEFHPLTLDNSSQRLTIDSSHTPVPTSTSQPPMQGSDETGYAVIAQTTSGGVRSLGAATCYSSNNSSNMHIGGGGGGNRSQSVSNSNNNGMMNTNLSNNPSYKNSRLNISGVQSLNTSTSNLQHVNLFYGKNRCDVGVENIVREKPVARNRSKYTGNHDDSQMSPVHYRVERSLTGPDIEIGEMRVECLTYLEGFSSSRVSKSVYDSMVKDLSVRYAKEDLSDMQMQQQQLLRQQTEGESTEVIQEQLQKPQQIVKQKRLTHKDQKVIMQQLKKLDNIGHFRIKVDDKVRRKLIGFDRKVNYISALSDELQLKKKKKEQKSKQQQQQQQQSQQLQQVAQSRSLSESLTYPRGRNGTIDAAELQQSLKQYDEKNTTFTTQTQEKPSKEVSALMRMIKYKPNHQGIFLNNSIAKAIESSIQTASASAAATAEATANATAAATMYSQYGLNLYNNPAYRDDHQVAEEVVVTQPILNVTCMETQQQLSQQQQQQQQHSQQQLPSQQKQEQSSLLECSNILMQEQSQQQQQQHHKNIVKGRIAAGNRPNTSSIERPLSSKLLVQQNKLRTQSEYLSHLELANPDDDGFKEEQQEEGGGGEEEGEEEGVVDGSIAPALESSHFCRHVVGLSRKNLNSENSSTRRHQQQQVSQQQQQVQKQKISSNSIQIPLDWNQVQLNGSSNDNKRNEIEVQVNKGGIVVATVSAEAGEAYRVIDELYGNQKQEDIDARIAEELIRFDGGEYNSLDSHENNCLRQSSIE